MQREVPYLWKASHKRQKTTTTTTTTTTTKKYQNIQTHGLEKCEIPRASKKTERQQQYREQRLVKPRGWQVRWELNILRCDHNRSPSSMCSQTAGAHRHEPPATYLCTCRTKCGRWQVLRNNKGGFLPRKSLFPHMPTATFRSTARLLDVAPVWHAVYHVGKQRHFHKNTIHDPHIIHCLLVTCARHEPQTHTKYLYIQIIFVLFFCSPCRCFFVFLGVSQNLDNFQSVTHFQREGTLKKHNSRGFFRNFTNMEDFFSILINLMRKFFN